MHYRGFASEYKNAQGEITTFTISIQTLDNLKEITRSTSGMEYNGSWHNPRQEIRQIKAKANIKMINNFYHINDYQLSRDKKYLEMIPCGR